MAPSPRYARFRKADLQMQTPTDRRCWTGASLDEGGAGIPHEPTPEQIDTSAKRYAERCIEVGLEVIGLTDHNLGGVDAPAFHAALLAHLAGSATVFPGFEVEARVGKGAHFLCLFEPGTDLTQVSDVLTELGLPPSSRFVNGNPAPSAKDFDELHKIVVEENEGVLIAAHALDAKGACNDATVAESWSTILLNDPRLLCIELPKPRDHYAEPGRHGKASKIVRGEDGWADARHPVAVVNSSDCKRLHADDRLAQSQTESWIGKRATWLKMGSVSIEGLRQAFLDHESRIAFPMDASDPDERAPDDRPERRAISTIEITGATFLAAQTIQLSPELNTFVGGGGTGKSTILEYLREAFNAERLTPDDPKSKPIIETLSTPGGSVRVQCGNASETMTVTLTSAGPQARGEDGEEIADIPGRFPVRVVSQREIYAISQDAAARRSLVDDLGRDALDALARQETALRARIEELDAAQATRAKRGADRARLVAEIARKKTDLSALSAQVGPLAALDALRAERALVERIDGRMADLAEEVRQFADDLVLGVSTSELGLRSSPHREAIEALRSRAAARVGATTKSIVDAGGALDAWRDREQSSAERSEWQKALATAEADYAKVSENAPEAGSPDDIQREIVSRTQELESVDREMASLEARLAEGEALRAELRGLWARETEERRSLAKMLAKAVPRTGDGKGKPYVTIEVDAFGDLESAVRRVSESVPDGRAFAASDRAQLEDLLREHRALDQNPIDLLCGWIESEVSASPLASFTDARRDALATVCTGTSGDRLRRFRTPDTVTVTLFRADGSEVGTLDGGLSVGQRCIAVLTLLLAMGDWPIVIDQPEDEIDNEFIYRELVPLLRRAKRQRQVILSTHNPNIPVNGDAELIYALEARGDAGGGPVRGWPKKVSEALSLRGGSMAVGSLDFAAVRLAVSEIMEGSEQAFRRRRAKYGF